MAAENTFEILGRSYPMVPLAQWRFSEWALVREITGLSSEEFVAAHEDGESGVDKLVVYGYAAVAFWRGNPRMSRSRARDAIDDWTETDVVFVAPAGEVDGDADVPPAGAGVGSLSSEEYSSTSEPSTPSQGSGSVSTSPSDGGSRGSDTGSPA